MAEQKKCKHSFLSNFRRGRGSSRHSVGSCCLVAGVCCVICDVWCVMCVSSVFCFPGTRRQTTTPWPPWCSPTCCRSWTGCARRSRTSCRGTTWRWYNNSYRCVTRSSVKKPSSGAAQQFEFNRIKLCTWTSCFSVTGKTRSTFLLLFFSRKITNAARSQISLKWSFQNKTLFF